MNGVSWLRTAVALGAGGVLAACASESEPEQTSFCGAVLDDVAAFVEATSRPVDDPRYGGTVVVGGGGDLVGGLNAFTTADQTTLETELHLFHATLLRLDEQRRPEPYLAVEWEVEPDNSGATIRIRDDMRWHDGMPVTIEDVAFTYAAAMDSVTGFGNDGWFDPYDSDGIEILDESTIRFRFSPHPDVVLPWASLPIMPAHLLGEVPRQELREHPFGTQCPVGAGPFLFEAYRPGDQWVLAANPGFPDDLGGRPFVDRYVYRVIANSTTRAAELTAGGVHVALGVEPSDGSSLATDDDVRIEVLDQRAFTFIGWNSRLPGLSDPQVRSALAAALDREGIARTLWGDFGQVAETGVPPFHWAYDPSLRGPAHDPDGAREALTASGWVDRDNDGIRENGAGEELRVELMTNPNPERDGVGRIVRDQLAEVGVSVDFAVQEMGTLQSRVLTPGSRDFGGFIMGWTQDFNINERDFFHSTAADGHPYGWAGTSDPELDRLLDTLPTLVDRDAALPLWRAYQERIIEVQPFTYLFFAKRLNGVAADLRGVDMDIRGELLSAARWYWDPARP